MSKTLDLRNKKSDEVKVVEKIITITKKRSFLLESGKLLLTILVASGVVFTISKAGSLIPPSGAPSKTMYTLDDIYTLVTTGTTTASTNFTTPGEATSTFHTLEDIVRDFHAPSSGGGTHNPNTAGPFVADGVADNGYLDQNTGLIWQNTDAGQYLCWDENAGCGPMQAKEYCQYLDADGVMVDADPQNIWRLPSIKEWGSVLDYNTQYPATSLPNTQASDFYWTGTEYAPYAGYAWYVDTYGGSLGNGNKYDSNLVRCVR